VIASASSHSSYRVLAAQRSGNAGDASTVGGQDRLFVLENAVIVLDGASSATESLVVDAIAPSASDASEARLTTGSSGDATPQAESSPAAGDPLKDGGWYADQLGQTLERRLQEQPVVSLQETLAAAIEHMVNTYDLTPGASPSSTVLIVRWSTELVEALILGDGAIVVCRPDHTTHQLIDIRLAQLAQVQRRVYRERLRAGTGYDHTHGHLLRALREEQRKRRNQPHGYWIAEADPEAAYHALTATWSRSDIDAVVLATDGVTAAIDVYRLYPDWPHLIEHADRDGPDAVLEAIHVAEAEDPDGRRWPRSKVHDDKTLAIVHL